MQDRSQDRTLGCSIVVVIEKEENFLYQFACLYLFVGWLSACKVRTLFVPVGAGTAAACTGTSGTGARQGALAVSTAYICGLRLTEHGTLVGPSAGAVVEKETATHHNK